MKHTHTGRFQNLLKPQIQEQTPPEAKQNTLQDTTVQFTSHRLDKLLPRVHFSKKIIVGVASVLLLLVGINQDDFQHILHTNTIQESIQFTGTVSPVEKVPNWAALSDRERTLSYSQLPPSKLIPLPAYDLSAMRRGQNYNGSTDTQRNTYVTYSVPYLGNYLLDGTENSGSHPGVDIKLPIGTPIRSIANGIVYKSEMSQYGFGNYITVKHPNIPDPHNPAQTITLYATYAHLNSRGVRMGQRVKKGDVLGQSGDTGDVTAPHLHFQIDSEEAPYYPYWPFTWDDVRQAGLQSFYDGVVHGVGKTNAQHYTIHPMNLLSSFENYGDENLVVTTDPVPIVPSTPTQDDTSTRSQDNEIKQNNESKNIDRNDTLKHEEQNTTDELHNKNNTNNSSSHTLVHSSSPQNESTPRNDDPRKTLPITKDDLIFENIRTFIPEQEQYIRLLIDEKSLVASADMIEVDTTLRSLAEVTPKKLTAHDFDNGIAHIQFKAYSDSPFKFVASGDFGEVKSKSLRAQVFRDVDPGHQYATAIRELKAKNVFHGYPDGTFKPEATLNRAESVKILLTGNTISVQKNAPLKFSDVQQGSWFTPYINTAAKLSIVKGYDDGSFKPGNVVSRIEFLKMAILTAGFNPTEDVFRAPYPDAPLGQWYTPFAEFTRANNLLRAQPGNRLAPADPITRGEAADVLYKLSQLKRI